jgi:ATP-dependent Clp protease ATP-binding subunit ClpA
MLERFSDRARRVIDLAQDEARMLNHNYVGTEHILLGLIHEGEGVAAQALESLGISLDAVRQQVEEIIGRGQQALPEHIPYTPRAKKVLELSLREALQLGHHYIGTEHILLGLIREGDGVAAQVLTGLGADLNRVRQQVIQLLQGHQGEQEPGTGRFAVRPGSARLRKHGLRALHAEIRERAELIGSQLSAIEQRVGAGPEVGDLDRQIEQVRRDKESAAAAEDYENAAASRDRERQLRADKASRQAEWTAAHPELASLAEGLHRLSDEVSRLRVLLRELGIEPRDGPGNQRFVSLPHQAGRGRAEVLLRPGRTRRGGAEVLLRPGRTGRGEDGGPTRPGRVSLMASHHLHVPCIRPSREPVRLP